MILCILADIRTRDLPYNLPLEPPRSVYNDKWQDGHTRWHGDTARGSKQVCASLEHYRWLCENLKEHLKQHPVEIRNGYFRKE
jgi:hypothetical protein